MISKTYTVLEYHEVEKLARDVLGLKNWSFVADLELTSDSSWDTEITDSEDILEAFIQVVKYKKAISAFPCYIARDVLIMLSFFGHIPTGNILVQVSW